MVLHGDTRFQKICEVVVYSFTTTSLKSFNNTAKSSKMYNFKTPSLTMGEERRGKKEGEGEERRKDEGRSRGWEKGDNKGH